MELINQFSELLLLDIRNILGLLFWGNLILASLFFTFRFALFSQDNNTHLLLFGLSKIFQSFAWLFFFIRAETFSVSLFNTLIPNTFVLVSYYLESIVMLMLVKDRSKRDYKLQTLVLVIGLLGLYVAVWLNVLASVRISLVSFIIFLLLITPVLRFLTETRSSLFKKLLGVNYCVLIIAVVVRIVHPFFKSSTSLYSGDPVQKIIFLIVFLMMIISGVGYLLLLQEEKEIQVKSLLDDKDKFFSIIAHDLRGPFTGIIGGTQLLLENQFSQKETRELIELIHESSKNTSSLLDNLLTWAQSQTGGLEFRPEKIEISLVVEKTKKLLESVAKTKNISIDIQIEDKQYVYADMNMLETIFRNLLANAIKFTRNNGKIVLSVRKERSLTIFSVQDSVIGIAPRKIENLFKIDEKHTTLGTNQEIGTGLGLLLCKDFIEKHGGEIWVKSQIGKGSDFEFSIPDHSLA